MRIPDGPRGSIASGRPTLSTSMIRSYGAGGMQMADQEQVKGCPSQYKQKYVTRVKTPVPRADVLAFGTAIHAALETMDRDLTGPEDALRKVWPAELSFERFQEATDDLQAYVARPGWQDTYAVAGHELSLYAPLYDDTDGPVFFGGRLDVLGIDPDTLTLAVIDWKTNRFPPTSDDLKGDVQMMGYAWLVRELADQLIPGLDGRRPNVVVILDAIKWYALEHRFTDDQLDLWAEWAAAIARKIRADAQGDPVLSPGCGWCDYKATCSAFQALPNVGESLAERLPQELADALEWQKRAKQTVSHLKVQIDHVTERLKEAVAVNGVVVIGDKRYETGEAWGSEIDLRELHELLGAEFYEVVGTSKAALERAIREPTARAQALSLFRRRVTGSRMKTSKAEEGEEG